MNTFHIEKLLTLVGCTNFKYGSAWIGATCPFASWRHAKGTDKRPSFGVIVTTEDESHFRCLSCNISGSLKTLVWLLSRYRGTGPWYDAACKLVAVDWPSETELDRRIAMAEKAPIERTREKLAKARYGSWGVPETTPQPLSKINLDSLDYVTLPESDLEVLRPLPKAACEYLYGPRRRLTALTAEVWGLKWQAERRRIVIPVRDHKGALVAITGRALDVQEDSGKWVPEQMPKFLHSKGFHRNFFLFGEHLIEKGQIGYLVEGHFDAMYLRQQGYTNALAVMGSFLAPPQVEKLVQFLSRVVILRDGDKAGETAAIQWRQALLGRIPVALADVKEGVDPDEYSDDALEAMLSLDNLRFA